MAEPVDVTRPAPPEAPAPSEEASNATEATREATADATTATAEAEAPAPAEGTSARQVNWTMMHGWERIRRYQSDDEEVDSSSSAASESEEEDLAYHLKLFRFASVPIQASKGEDQSEASHGVALSAGG